MLRAALAIPDELLTSLSHSDGHEPSWTRSLKAALDSKTDSEGMGVSTSFASSLTSSSAQGLLRLIYLAQELMETPSAKPAQLAACLQHLIRSVAHSLRCRSIEDRPGHDRFLACARAMSTFYRGVEGLSSIDSADPDRMSVIFAAVQLYNDLLVLFTIPESISPHESTTGSTAEHVPQEDTQYLTILVAFLIYLVDALSSKLEVHRKLFEGYLFVLLATTGRQIYPAVFGHARGSSLEAEMRASKQVTEDILQDLMVASRSRLLHLVRLLKHVINKASIFLVDAQAASSIKDRLQYTLVEAIFGEHGRSFLDAQKLQLPSVSVQLEENVLSTQSITAAKWFVQEVWSIIGWDVIAQ